VAADIVGDEVGPPDHSTDECIVLGELKELISLVGIGQRLHKHCSIDACGIEYRP
jgi:hypothetical protein